MTKMSYIKKKERKKNILKHWLKYICSKTMTKVTNTPVILIRNNLMR